MKDYSTMSECRSYVSAHCHATASRDQQAPKPPSVTISRQAGARGRTIGHKLKDALTANKSHTHGSIPWSLFDDDLVNVILEDNDLPQELEKFMPDDAIGELEGSINEILGRHPSLWTLFEDTVKTIARLSSMGHSIIVGRAGNMVTKGLPNVLRIRLIGSEANRVHQMTHAHGMSPKEAVHYVKKEDAARKRYLKQHYSTDIDSPEHYDLVINTDYLDDDAVVALLVSAVESKY